MPPTNEHRIQRELNKMQQFPSIGISVKLDEQINNFEVKITGPENSPYNEKVFTLIVNVPDNYPFEPPSIKFRTKIYHPNIDEEGRICLDVLRLPPKGSWRPTIGIENLLVAIRMLLEHPNPDDPLMPQIAEEFINNSAEFYRKAKEFSSLNT